MGSRQIVRDGRIVQDDWEHVDEHAAVPQRGNLFVSLTRWERERDALKSRTGQVGLRVPGDVDTLALSEVLEGVSAIAIEFAKFTDGRGYTAARLLRERCGFEGEVRAVGQVLRDQMFYMARCGFNAFELEPGKDLATAVSALSDFSVVYQPATDESQPLWRRVHRPGPSGSSQ